jgi:hypothetical protein
MMTRWLLLAQQKCMRLAAEATIKCHANNRLFKNWRNF